MVCLLLGMVERGILELCGCRKIVGRLSKALRIILCGSVRSLLFFSLFFLFP